MRAMLNSIRLFILCLTTFALGAAAQTLPTGVSAVRSVEGVDE
jgi:hypothetical protein